MNQYLEYHLRGICTSTGLDILNTVLSKESISNE